MSLEVLAQLGQLAQFASSAGSRSGSTPVYNLSVEEARKLVSVKNASKNPTVGGPQKLSVYLTKTRLSLDAVSPGATVIVAPEDQVEKFTTILEEAVAAGAFDAAIKEGQEKAREAARKSAESKAASAEVVSDSAPESAEAADLLDELDNLG